MVAVCESRAKAKRNGTEKKNYATTDEFKLYPARAGMAVGGCSEDSIRRMAKELVRLGWLVVVKRAAAGWNNAAIYRVVRHKEWCRTHTKNDCILFKYDENGEKVAY